MASELRVNKLTNRSGLGTVTYTDTGAIVSGIVTATSFSGTASGNPTLTNGADNRVITASSASAIQGESALTFNGQTLTVSAPTNDTPLIIDTGSSNGAHLRFQKDGANKHFVGSGGGFGLGDVDDLALRTVDNIIFGVGTSEKVRIASDGKTSVGTVQTTHTLGVTGGSSSQLLVKGGEADIWLTSTGGSTTTWRILGSTGGSTHQFRIYDATNSRDAFTISNDGNIGVYGIPVPSFSAINSVAAGTVRGIEIFRDGTDTGTALKLAGDNGSGTKAWSQLGYSGANATAHWANYNTAGQRVGEIIIGSTGNIGIGDRTTNPDADLHVHTSSGESTIHIEAATNANLNLRSHSGDSTVKFSDGSASNVGNINYDHATDSLSFRVNASPRLTITSGGVLCVGATAADGDEFLRVKNKLLVMNTANTGDAFVKIKAGETGGSVLEFEADEGDDYADLWRVQNAGDGLLGFRTKASGSWVQKLSVHNDKVMFSVDAKVDTDNTKDLGASGARWRNLHLGTSARIGATGTTASTAGDDLVIEGSSDRGLSIISGSGSSANIYFGDSGDADVGRIAYQHNDNAIDFQTNGGGVRLRIDSQGKIGINDTSPSAYLDIAQGGIDSNVPGINIAMTGVGGGTAGEQYGIKITGGGYNNATHIYGIFVDKTAQLSQQNTAGHHKMSGTYNTLYGTQSIIQVNDTGATGTAYGLYASARGNSGSAKNKVGYGAWIESTGTNFQLCNAVRLKTVAGSTLIYGIIYQHGSTEVFRISANGDVWSATNSYSSDRDLKDNIVNLSGTSLDKIKQLTPRQFNWKLDDRQVGIDSSLTAPTNTLTGLIAQEVKPILPDIVSGTDGEKDMGINYNGLVAHLVNAVKELSVENEAMRARLDALESS